MAHKLPKSHTKVTLVEVIWIKTYNVWHVNANARQSATLFYQAYMPCTDYVNIRKSQ